MNLTPAQDLALLRAELLAVQTPHSGIYVGGREVRELDFLPNGHPTNIYVGGRRVYG